MRARTYQNKEDKKSDTFHYQLTFDTDEAELLVSGDKDTIAAVKQHIEELLPTEEGN